MNRPLKKNEKIQIGLLALSCVIIVLGILFLVNAMQEDPSNGFFPAFCEMDNILAKYIIVILTMACGIMLFSNVGITVEDKKLRNGLTIGITAFSTVLTVPLVYVFVALLPYAANPIPFEAMTNPVDALMRTDRIYEGFVMWFGDGGLLWAALVIMLLLSLVFITFPLLTGILAVKNGQTLGIKKRATAFPSESSRSPCWRNSAPKRRVPSPTGKPRNAPKSRVCRKWRRRSKRKRPNKIIPAKARETGKILHTGNLLPRVFFCAFSRTTRGIASRNGNQTARPNGGRKIRRLIYGVLCRTGTQTSQEGKSQRTRVPPGGDRGSGQPQTRRGQ